MNSETGPPITNHRRAWHNLLGFLVLVSIVNSLLAQPNNPGKAAPDGEQFHPTRIIAKLKAGESAGSQPTALRQHRLKVHRQFKLLPQVVVLDLEDQAQTRAVQALPPQARAKRLREEIARLQATGLYEYVEPDYIRHINAEPTDSAFTDGTLWALRNLGQNNGVAGADIGAVAAWDITTGSTNVIVAVVDTSIRYTHQDLAANMWRNPGESGGGKETNGKDDDGDGYIDNVYGINAIYGTNTIQGGDPMDDSVDRYGNPEGHGTHVAGTIGAAANNGSSHVGVAWNVRLMACKTLNADGGASSCEAYVSDTTECIAFAVAKGARIINASYGGPAFSQTEFDSIRAACGQGVLFVAAAGNNRSGGQDNDTSWLRSYPASYALENIVSVAALDRSDSLAWFSHFGRMSVHLGAPGVEIYSCVNGSDSSYGSMQGTSMATPHVVGAAALILANHPSASLVELRRRILNGAVPIPSLTNRTVTGGRLNVFNALGAAPTGNLNVEVFPRTGQFLAAGRSATLSVIISDLLPATNATVLARISSFANLSLFAGDAGKGIYTASFVVPTNLSSLQVSLEVSAPGWQSITNQVTYPVVFPPANDNFADRIAIPQSLCLTTVSAFNGNATKEPGEPYHGTGLGGRSVWWSWTAPFNGPMKMSTAGSWVITALALYTGAALTNLSLVVSNDDASYYDWYSVVTFEAVAGTEYQIAVDGIGPDPGQIVLGVLPLVTTATLANALDNSALTCHTGGDAPWFGQTCVAHDGSDAVRSAPIEANGETWLETTVFGPGILSFWWKVSSEANWDFLRFYPNGVKQSSVSGEVDWQQERRWLGVGSHTLRWSYCKDFVDIYPKGQDAGWLDEALAS